MNDSAVPSPSKAMALAAERMKKIPAEWLIALVIGLAHLVVAGRYDIFRNELYFIGANFTGTPIRFEIIQLFEMNILLAPLWITGVVAPFLWTPLKPARFLSVGLIGASILAFVAHGKNYYLFPVYPSLFAVGAVVMARIRPILRTVWVIAALIVSLIYAPIALPILDPPALAS